jgi:hypothetical protein
MFDEIETKDEVNFEEKDEDSNQNLKTSEEKIKKDAQANDVTSEIEPKKEIEDIFFDGEDDLEIENSNSEEAFYNKGKEKPAVFAPVESSNKQEEEPGGVFSFLKIVGVFIFIVFLVVGGYFAYANYLKEYIADYKNNSAEQELIENSDKTGKVVEIEDNNPQIEETQINDKNVIENRENIIKEEKDTDGDGLSDRREMELGININNIDTDGDNLFDREEVVVYGTDPKNKDTDGDGFLDGAEVEDGYNPKGEGRLYDINQ